MFIVTGKIYPKLIVINSIIPYLLWYAIMTRPNIHILDTTTDMMTNVHPYNTSYITFFYIMAKLQYTCKST